MLRARKRLDYAGACGCDDAVVCGLLKWFVARKLKELSSRVLACVLPCAVAWMWCRRTAVANFDINITSSGISGLWIAAPGTGIDSASGLNGWIDSSINYGGSGVPGSDTSNGGNGSNAIIIII